MKKQEFDNFLAAVRAGDRAAAEALVRRYEPYLRRVIRLRLTDARLRRVLDSMDICQSILGRFFAGAAAGRFQLDSPDDLRRLLVAMALNRLRTHARKERRHEALPAEATELPAPDPTPSKVAANRDLSEAILKLLGDKERWLAEQRSLGRSWAELGQELGQRPEALRMGFARALVRVRRALDLED